MDRVTFDFETSEVIIYSKSQQGSEYVPHLKDKKSAIMAAAGLEEISMAELRDEINRLCIDLGLDDVRCAEPDDLSED